MLYVKRRSLLSFCMIYNFSIGISGYDFARKLSINISDEIYLNKEEGFHEIQKNYCNTYDVKYSTY